MALSPVRQPNGAPVRSSLIDLGKWGVAKAAWGVPRINLECATPGKNPSAGGGPWC
jgi:hypothetical protein